MPAKNRNQRYQLKGSNICEFHKDATKQILRCEGYGESCAVGLSFGDAANKKEWQRQYCEKLGAGCPYRESLLRYKY